MSLSNLSWRGLLVSSLVFAVLVAGGCGASSGRDMNAKKRKGPLHHYQLARMYFEQGNVPRALEEVERSLRMDDELPQTHFFKGFVHYNLEHWEKAETSFRRALELHTMFTDARMYLADTLEKLGRHDEAVGALRDALADRTYPQQEKIHFNLAMLHDRQGKTAEAISELRRAIEMRPRYYRAPFELAQRLEEAGHADEALVSYAAAEPGFPRDARFHFLYGAALFRANRMSEANRELLRVIELAPGTEDAREARRLLGVMG